MNDSVLRDRFHNLWYSNQSVDERIRHCVRNFTSEECREALTVEKYLPRLQASVIRAIESRLRKLSKVTK